MATKDYNDPRWQKIRLRILERDGFACKACGNTDITLHIHHLRYKKGKRIWDVNDDDLETLCELCHKHIEDLLNKVRENSVFIIKKSLCAIESIADASAAECLDECDELQYFAAKFLEGTRSSCVIWEELNTKISGKNL